MSADSLFSIVVPAPTPVAASKAAGTHGDSGFDRMVGEAMDTDPEQARPAGKIDTPLTRAGTAASRPATDPTSTSPLAPTGTDDTITEADPDAIPLATDAVAGQALSPVIAADSKATDDAQVLPGITTDKGGDIPQVLPGTSPTTVTPQIETPPKLTLTSGKGADGPQILPGEVGTGPVPEPVVSAKGTDAPQVLPGLSGKSEGPQILPGPVPAPGAGKSADRQILPGAETGARTGTTAEPATPAVTATATKAAAAAMAAMAPTVAPPPVRPLADRTGTVSNSVRATGDRTSGSGSGSLPATATTTVAAASSVSGSPTTPDTSSLSDRPLTPAVGVPVIPVANTPDIAARAPVDQPPVEVPPAPVTPAGTASQTYSLSNISNSAIEATAQLAAQIIRRLDARSTRFEMALTPDQLGRVDVSLDIDESGRLAARLAFDNPAAALDMKGRVDDLRRQLEAAGFHLADDAFQFAERDRSSGEAFDRRQGRAFAAASRLSDETDAAAPVTAPRWMSLSLTPDRVDMKV